jgi:hypothetical protein
LAIGLHGDKTMYTNANVRSAYDGVRSARSTGATRALTEGDGASGTSYRRPHAPRSAPPKTAGLTDLHFDMSSTGELDSATPRLRISECARPSLRQLDLIRASYRRRIGDSPTDQVSKIHSPIWSRGRTAHSSHPPLGWSVDSYSRHQLAAYCSPRFNQLRSTDALVLRKRSRIPAPIPRPVHRIALTTLQPAPAMTHVPKQLTGSANDCGSHQISHNKSCAEPRERRMKKVPLTEV